MDMGYLEQIFALASAPLATPQDVAISAFQNFGHLGSQLREMLSMRNGFYAFESALHVFPDNDMAKNSLQWWNSKELWRCEYGELAESQLFFAEDVFGDQFCIHESWISRFDAEDGQLTPIAANIEEWAQLIREDYCMQTGYPLAHEWQLKHGALPDGKRLLPEQPFVLGGKYTIDNLYLANSVEGMQYRGSVARQIHYLPNGTKIALKSDQFH
jgi:hypothetical protein